MNERQRWNRLHDRSHAGAPCHVLTAFAHFLPASGDALDLAAGQGTNSIFMAQRGLRVQAWDISDVALEKIAFQAKQADVDVTVRQVDIAPDCLGGQSFDVMLVSRFLDRTLYKAIGDALRPGGLLFYETFTRIRLPGASGPSNPDYLLAPNELLKAFEDLTIVAYLDEPGTGDPRKGVRNLSYLVAQKPPTNP